MLSLYHYLSPHFLLFPYPASSVFSNSCLMSELIRSTLPAPDYLFLAIPLSWLRTPPFCRMHKLRSDNDPMLPRPSLTAHSTPYSNPKRSINQSTIQPIDHSKLKYTLATPVKAAQLEYTIPLSPPIHPSTIHRLPQISHIDTSIPHIQPDPNYLVQMPGQIIPFEHDCQRRIRGLRISAHIQEVQ